MPEFYPGQIVAGPLAALDQATWLHTTKDMKAARKQHLREHKVRLLRYFVDIAIMFATNSRI
jgi:hypothetical protein